MMIAMKSNLKVDDFLIKPISQDNLLLQLKLMLFSEVF